MLSTWKEDNADTCFHVAENSFKQVWNFNVDNDFDI